MLYYNIVLYCFGLIYLQQAQQRADAADISLKEQQRRCEQLQEENEKYQEQLSILVHQCVC